jgi:hypothetical protein
MRELTHYIPIASSAFAMFFTITLALHWNRRQDSAWHLAWWTAGVFLFGVGTITETIIGMFGWSEGVFRVWYVAGALLGGAPLAQGTVYLLLKRRTAHVLSAVLITVILIASVCIMLSPINFSVVEPFRPSGKALAWQWVRLFSPFVNTYALIFLVGGAGWSAWKFKKSSVTRNRFVGNVLIAVGALLPGIGGSFTRFGLVEVLYVTEFIGLVLIYIGYRKTQRELHVANL